MLGSLQILTKEAVAREGDALQFAPIGVLSQRERHAINLSQAIAFAKARGRPLFKWRLNLCGDSAGWIDNEAVQLAGA